MPYTETYPDYLRPPFFQRIPRRFFGATTDFLKKPYEFISENCSRYNSDVFEARLFFRKTYFFRGEKATELFYASDNFMRAGAAHEAIKASLLGKKNCVQNLDGETHLLRKKLFLDVLSPSRISSLSDLVGEKLLQNATHWAKESRLNFYESSQKILTEAACQWLGIPLDEKDVEKRRKQLTAMFDKAGSKGLGHLYARFQRKRAEWWIKELIQETLLERKAVSSSSIINQVIRHKENGVFLDLDTTANEILNLLRPIVAVAVYATFIAHALEMNPELRQYVNESSKNLENFVHEVRRFYPFFPAIMAKTKLSFEFNGYYIRKNRRALLDIYGTNHDPRLWRNPDKFDPDRFNDQVIKEFNFIPQGGGNAATNHRCAGEQATIEIMKTFTKFLTQKMSYKLPKQDLTIDKRRLPALPQSRIILKDIQLI